MSSSTPFPNPFRGPNSEYVKLVSSDGQEFIVKRREAYVSKSLYDLIEHGPRLAEEEEAIYEVPNIQSGVLELVCMYLMYTNLDIPLSELALSDEMKLNMFVALNALDC